MAVRDSTDGAVPAPVGGTAPLLRGAAPPVIGLALGAGVALSMQAFVNGRLGGSVGSPELAGTISLAIALALVIVFTTATGTLARAGARFRAGARLRPWHVAICANGALVIIVMAEAAPKVGVALLTVAVVCGQLGGGLLVDAVGMSPAGRRPFTLARACGLALALLAITIGALGKHGDLHLGLLFLAVLAGTSISLHQAALGHISNVTGDPVVAAAVTFGVSGVVALIAWLIVDHGAAPSGWSAPPLEWLGGVTGVIVVVSMAKAVSALGVLQLALGVVAGQAAGALVIDLVAPAAGGAVNGRTVLSAVLMLLAVLVSGMTLGAGRRRT